MRKQLGEDEENPLLCSVGDDPEELGAFGGGRPPKTKRPPKLSDSKDATVHIGGDVTGPQPAVDRSDGRRNPNEGRQQQQQGEVRAPRQTGFHSPQAS